MSHSSRTIHVANLPGDVRQSEIKDLFHKYGRIVDIDLKKRSKGLSYCFIKFDDPRDAEDAIRGRDGYDFDGCRLRVEFAHGGGRGSSDRHGRRSSSNSVSRGVSTRSKYRVLVTGLPLSASRHDLKDHMRSAGEVCFAKLFRESNGTRGVVGYTNYEDMKNAIGKLDDTKFRSPFSHSYIRVKEDTSSRRSMSRSRNRSRSRSRGRTRSRSHSRSRSRSRSMNYSRSRNRCRSKFRSRSLAACSRSRSPENRSGSPARRSPSARKRQKSATLQEDARTLGLSIREEFSGLDLQCLSTTAMWRTFSRPVVGETGIDLYDYMGRETTKTMVEFILNFGHHAPRIIEVQDIAYVVGTPGYGKSTSMATAFGYLYTTFAKESPRQRRVLYLKGQDFAWDPCTTLFGAILLAYTDVDVKLDGEDYGALVGFLRSRRREQIYLLFDDGNAMDGDEAPTESTKSYKASLGQRAEAQTKLHVLSKRCITVVCASVWILDHLKTDKAVPYKLFAGGFTDAERVTYLNHYKKQLLHADLEQTGSVPRLLHDFMFDKAALKASLSWYEEGIREYIDAVIHDRRKRSQVCMMLTCNSETGEVLPDVMKSRCFFRGPSNTIECLTTHLKSYAFGYLAISVRELETLSASEKIGMWTATIPTDTNIARIGWNAEAATIAAFSLLRLEVDLSDCLSKPVDAETPLLFSADIRELCLGVLERIMSRGDAMDFTEPVEVLVSAEVWKQYKDIIKTPMDLGTVYRKLKGNGYDDIKAFRTDMDLVFRNATQFNAPRDAIHKAALRLQAKFEKDLMESLKSVKADGTKLVFNPEVVVHFEGKFHWSMLRNDKATLCVPRAFNHYGADMYYSDAGTVVVIQVTVRRNGKETHVNARRLMQSCPWTELRRKILLWVLPFAPWEHQKMEGYEEVQVSFSKLHEELSCIDHRCSFLRRVKETDCVYCGSRDYEKLPCSSCLYWFHRACAEKDCSETEPFEEPFECRYCRTKGKRLFDFP